MRSILKNSFFSLLILMILFGAAPVLAATCTHESQTENCDNAECAGVEAGIMEGVCTVCWEQGKCSLDDFLVVFVNVADYILGIVGSLALLLFVIGGLYLLVAQGESSKIQKGKNFIIGAVVGLVIVFGAYIGVQTVTSVLLTGELAGQEGFQICDGTNDGSDCAENSECYRGFCVSKCAANSDLTNSCQPASIYGGYSECSTGSSVCPQGEDEVCCEPGIVE